MRFFCDGPNIPDLLLERRDQGRVVFLCGAGVSLNAGMPTFLDLTKHVMDFFDPPESSQVATSFQPWVEEDEGPKTPLDQIFHLLYQEYGRADVNALVAERLCADSGGSESKEHKIVSRISSDQAGNPQVVTTNFDLLFEQTLDGKSGIIYEPPAFPDISLGVPLTGLIYLHGRLKEPDASQHSYVLSSADFGRAYLSEAWATNFIRALLGSYTVVLVGYQAEDPPVRYLLQGLNHDGLSDRSNLYAFDKGDPEEIEAKWRDRGVTAIAYKDHPHLWQSLGAWADRADNARGWRSKVIDLAMQSPRQIAAFERGQVTHLVRTAPGARLFASADPSPPAEWLCVFDSACRVAKKSKSYGEDAEIFDPFQEYALDDDPPRPLAPGRLLRSLHDNIFEWRRGDTNPSASHRLGGRQAVGFEEMPPRLNYLSNWISKNLGSTVTAWWALRQNGLHPRLMAGIRRELRKKTKLHQEGRRIWNLILEHQSDSRNFSQDSDWFELKDRIEVEGWTSSVLRDFEDVTKPILSYSLPFGIGASKPPFQCWEEICSTELAIWEVKFPDRHGEAIDIPDEALESVFNIVEGHLHRAAGLLKDLNINYFTTPTCYPNREVDGQEHERDATFRWFVELFIRMIRHLPTKTRAHAIMWSTEDKYYFRKLKLFAMNHADLFEADEAAEVVLNLNQELFWDDGVTRELMFLINDRWESFSEANRIALADRILNGPDKREQWSEDEFLNFKLQIACRCTKWLTLQGRDLSKDQTARLDEMIAKFPEWNDGWASSFVTQHYGYSGSVVVDEAPDTIIDLPVKEVLEQAKICQQRAFRSFTEKRPFSGLVKANPRKALASLSYEARKGEYPQEFWSTLIREWPENTKSRLFRFFLIRLCGLPDESIKELRYAIGQWIEKRFLTAYQFDKDLAWKTFDHLVSGLTAGKGGAAESGDGEIRGFGEIVRRSRRTVDYAFNRPIGNTTEGLLNTLNSLGLSEGQGIPDDFKTRLELLIAAPGEQSDHTVSLLTQQINWLYYLDPKWVMCRIMPWFNFENSASEPAWNGYLSAAKIPPLEIGMELKPLLLELFPTIYRWDWDHGLVEIAAQIVVELAVFHSDKPDGLNVKEARHCLRSMNDQNRQDSVTQLGKIGQCEENGWSIHVIPFINTVWPRERAFRTSTLVRSWVSLLLQTGESFPTVLNSVFRFLVPVEGVRHWLYRFSRGARDEQSLTVMYPEAVLQLIDAVIPNSTENIPYELAQILELLEETDPNLVQSRSFLRLINLVEQS